MKEPSFVEGIPAKYLIKWVTCSKFIDPEQDHPLIRKRHDNHKSPLIKSSFLYIRDLMEIESKYTPKPFRFLSKEGETINLTRLEEQGRIILGIQKAQQLRYSDPDAECLGFLMHRFQIQRHNKSDSLQ